MAEKQDRGRFTLRLNQKDPAHESVISILEQQGKRGKSRYIVNAILHYVHCPETPDIVIPTAVNREFIETIVMDILRGYGHEQEGEQRNQNDEIDNESIQNEKETGNSIEKNEIGDTMIDLIKETLSSFRTGM